MARADIFVCWRDLAKRGATSCAALADSGCVSLPAGEALSIEPTRHGNEVSLAYA